MKKFISLFVIMIALFAVTGCFIDAGTEIEFVSMPKSVYPVNYSIEQAKGEISVKVTSGTNTQVLNLNSSLLTISGLDFSNAGTYTLVVKYDTVSISYEYMVVDGTQEDPTEIDIDWYDEERSTFYLQDLGDLLGFAAIVNGKASVPQDGEASVLQDNFKNKTVYLMADIDLTDVIWTPIGEGPRKVVDTTDATPDNVGGSPQKGMFQGTFDGLGHTITGLTDEGYIPQMAVYKSSTFGVISGATFGLFGRASNATIKNINVVNMNITGFVGYNTTTSEHLKIYSDASAALVGYSYGNMTFENCSVSGIIIGDDASSALLGRGYGEAGNTVKLTNCTSDVEISLSSEGKAGGLIGFTYAVDVHFTNCSFTGVNNMYQKRIDGLPDMHMPGGFVFCYKTAKVYKDNEQISGPVAE